MECVMKNSRITFENTFDKLPFKLEIFALKLMEKNLLIEWKN